MHSRRNDYSSWRRLDSDTWDVSLLPLEPMVNAFMTLADEVRKTRDILTPALHKFGKKAKTSVILVLPVEN